jgi:hypothetical protein
MSKSRKSQYKSLAVALAMGLVGAAFGFLVAKGAMGLAPVRDSLEALSAWDLLVLPLIWLFVIAVHEGGHLLGGMARGMRFLLLIVGPFGLVRAGERIEFRWFFNLGTLGGVAAAVPNPDFPLKPQLQRLIVGGPLASLLLAALCAGVFMLTDGRVAAYALMTAALSATIFMVTAAPMRAGGFMSDGMQFLSLARDPGMVERRARLIGLMGLGLAGNRPRDLDPALLAQAQQLAGNETMYDIGVWIYSFFNAWDRGDREAAGQWLDRIATVIDEYPDGFRQSVAIELALYEAWQRRDLAAAQAWMARAKGGVVDASRRALAEAAVSLLQGQVEQADAALERARRMLARGMDPGLAKLSADQISELPSALGKPAPSLHAA